MRDDFHLANEILNSGLATQHSITDEEIVYGVNNCEVRTVENAVQTILNNRKTQERERKSQKIKMMLSQSRSQNRHRPYPKKKPE